jgi:hypothetical protein
VAVCVLAQPAAMGVARVESVEADEKVPAAHAEHARSAVVVAAAL